MLVSDHFDFGLALCGVGGSVAKGGASWYLKVNHKALSIGGDKVKLKRGDEVLWDLAPSYPYPDELALAAPDRVRAGKAFQVRVFSYDEKGKRKPASGVRVRGASGPTDEDRRATVTLTRPARLIARGGATSHPTARRFAWGGSARRAVSEPAPRHGGRDRAFGGDRGRRLRPRPRQRGRRGRADGDAGLRDRADASPSGRRPHRVRHGDAGARTQRRDNHRLRRRLRAVDRRLRGQRRRRARLVLLRQRPLGADRRGRYQLHGGEAIWWDYRDWSVGERVAAAVGSWPQPFADGYEGSFHPTAV